MKSTILICGLVAFATAGVAQNSASTEADDAFPTTTELVGSVSPQTCTAIGGSCPGTGMESSTGTASTNAVSTGVELSTDKAYATEAAATETVSANTVPTGTTSSTQTSKVHYSHLYSAYPSQGYKYNSSNMTDHAGWGGNATNETNHTATSSLHPSAPAGTGAGSIVVNDFGTMALLLAMVLGLAGL